MRGAGAAGHPELEPELESELELEPARAKSRTVVLGNEEETYWDKNDLFAPVIQKAAEQSYVGSPRRLLGQKIQAV